MTDKSAMTIGFDVANSIDGVTVVSIRRGTTIIGIFSGDIAKAFIELNTEAYARGRRDGLEESCGVVFGLCRSDNTAQRTVNAIRALKEKNPKK